MKISGFGRVALSALALFLSSLATASEEPRWFTSADEAFAAARREHRFVILDLEAVWCHWCHVMEHETYGDAAVRKVLAASYVTLKIDQDSSPDISARYGDWGWPATIVFAADGSEIVKRRGYIPPQKMLALLNAIIADPSPGPSVAPPVDIIADSATNLTTSQRATLLDNFSAIYDHNNGGWGDGQRYIDASSMELSLALAHAGDADAEKMARQTLDRNLALIDPVWGGVYQYSVGPGWNAPHFEKIMSFQADDLRLYALAYAKWHDANYLKAAQAIERYLTQFLLSPDGAFYVSQDADLSSKVDGHAYYALGDKARRQLGLPRIDAHLYTRENGWAIDALCQAHDSLGDDDALRVAKRAALWIVDQRSLSGGGFRHDREDRAGPYLADNIAMTQALLSLYRSSGERHWLATAEQTLDFIQTRFAAADIGYVTAPVADRAAGVFAVPMRIVDENIALARVANMAYRVTGNVKYRKLGENAIRFSSAAANLKARPFLPGLILADREFGSDPIHIAIVGAKDDANAKALQTSALSYPSGYLRVDWFDRREGALPNPDVAYPTLAKAAAFVCTGSACSLPVFQAAQIAPAVDRLRAAISDSR